ncbi:MAG: RidA family protein [Spirochaetes bacterium]|nr:RidA family protein [Spirochaetota bacterium]
MIKYINTKNAPAAIGPYTQAVKHGNLVFTSGQISIDPATGNFIEGSIEIQTIQVLENLKAVLEASGSTMQNVIKTTVFLSDMKDFAAMNSIYAEYFTGKPARSTVAVRELPKKALIEIECIAAVPEN